MIARTDACEDVGVLRGEVGGVEEDVDRGVEVPTIDVQRRHLRVRHVVVPHRVRHSEGIHCLVRRAKLRVAAAHVVPHLPVLWRDALRFIVNLKGVAKFPNQVQPPSDLLQVRHGARVEARCRLKELQRLRQPPALPLNATLHVERKLGLPTKRAELALY